MTALIRMLSGNINMTICRELHLSSEASHGKHRTRGNITEQSRKSRKYVVLEFRDFLVLFRDVFRSVYSSEGEARSGEQAFGLRTVFSVGENTINDEGGMARDE